jgi:beta-galactosidase
VTYQGTVLSEKLQEKALARVLDQAGLMGPDQKLPEGIRVKHGAARAGKPLHYYFNVSATPREVPYPYGAGTELLSERSQPKGSTLMLEPWGVAIVEEAR